MVITGNYLRVKYVFERDTEVQNVHAAKHHAVGWWLRDRICMDFM